MAFDRAPPTDEEIERWFVLKEPDLPPGRFEFALVLGGTVSAGAYTAGALDFLFEALDAFEAAKAAGEVPRHDVTLRAITGTSGGGVNAAIAARALAYDFPHVRATSPVPAPGAPLNPFYEIWINRLRLEGFLDPSDIARTVPAALNGAPIDQGAAWLERYTAPALAAPRPWLAAPLPVILTLTNVCGVPYAMEFGETGTEEYVDHADHVRFALRYPGQQAAEPRPDEFTLGFDGQEQKQAASWSDFSLFARATSAFPLGFPTRQLVRPLEQYRWRPVPVPPGPDETGRGWRLLRPDWDAMTGGADPLPELYHFSAVDGGATNNEPLQLAHMALAGLAGRNARAPNLADRALLLIDPFAGRAPVGGANIAGLAETANATLSALLQQTRYGTADLLLAEDAAVASRFMLTATRGDRVGIDAIASGGLGAFIGFACPEFMRHDYSLGRANCQRFLLETFLLDASNDLFARYPPEQRRAAKLPIIPLCGTAASDQAPAPWPVGALDPETFRKAIEARFTAILQAELTGNLLLAVLGWFGARLGRRDAAGYVIDAMNAYLGAAGLAGGRVG
jgi:hypothetical protein